MKVLNCLCAIFLLLTASAWLVPALLISSARGDKDAWDLLCGRGFPWQNHNALT
jgi:hypothetical protein